MVEAILFFFAGVITLTFAIILFVIVYEDLPIVKKYQKHINKFADIVNKVTDNIVPIFWLLVIITGSISFFIMSFKSLLG